MAVNYFNKFPKTFFDVNNDGSFSVQVDITKTVDINTIDEDKITYYTYYEIQDGERPDILSHSLYGTPQYYWTFFVVNDSLKAGLYNSWPLNSQEFERMMANEYDSYSSISFNPILHESLSDGVLTQDFTASAVSDFSVVPLIPIDNLLTPVDDQDEYLPYLRLSRESLPGEDFDQPIPTAKILKYENTTCQLVVYDIRDNVETSINITNGGSGYGPTPAVTFSAPPSGGTTATGIAVVGSQGSVTNVAMTNPGSGYVTPPTVTITAVFEAPPTGSPTLSSGSATGTAVIDSQGSVTNVAITSSDEIFIPAPPVTFGAAPSGGTTATGIAVVGSQGSVTNVAITNPGQGYTKDPTVTFGLAPSGGTTAKGSAKVSKPVSDRSVLLKGTTFKLLWVNPYSIGTDDYTANEALKARYVNTALTFFKPIDQYFYPGKLSDTQQDSTPTYADTPLGRERYIFDKKYLKILDNNSNIYSFELYRNATAQYTLTQTNTIDGETVLIKIPVSLYDVLHNNNGSIVGRISFYEKEEQTNSNKRNIKVIKPNAIQNFSKTYFDLLNI